MSSASGCDGVGLGDPDIAPVGPTTPALAVRPASADSAVRASPRRRAWPGGPRASPGRCAAPPRTTTSVPARAATIPPSRACSWSRPRSRPRPAATTSSSGPSQLDRPAGIHDRAGRPGDRRSGRLTGHRHHLHADEPPEVADQGASASGGERRRLGDDVADGRAPARRRTARPATRTSALTSAGCDRPSSRPISNAAARLTSSRPSGVSGAQLVADVGERAVDRVAVGRQRTERAPVPGGGRDRRGATSAAARCGRSRPARAAPGGAVRPGRAG